MSVIKMVITLYPAHPTLWMVVLAPESSFWPNPTGSKIPASPLAAARSQPSQVAPLLFGLELERLWTMLWTPLDAVDDAVDATRCWGRCRRGGTLDGEVVEEKTQG